MFDDVVHFIRDLYSGAAKIPLHEPCLNGLEKKYVDDCLDSTFVSSVGQYVNQFEKQLEDFTGAAKAIATSNGTAALHVALVAAGVQPGTEVLTQALTFVATANAISYCGAEPVFLDSDPQRMSLSTKAVAEFLDSYGDLRNDGSCYNKKSGRKIIACLPMHVFGHPADLSNLKILCQKYHLQLIEDAAESLGSFYNNQHTGLIGDIGVLSFNGNKIITTGGGGAVIVKDPQLGARIKHLTTTAKQPHRWEFYHDELGFNYRLPNLNAALGCAQMESLPAFLENKRQTFEMYKEFFNKKGIPLVEEPKDSKSNYWLNAILLKDRRERDLFLETTNQQGVMTRPAWNLMTELPMYKDKTHDDLINATNLVDRIVNLPSSVRR